MAASGGALSEVQWPEDGLHKRLSGDLFDALIRAGWTRADFLYEALDSLDEAYQLVSGLDGVGGRDNELVCAAELMSWKASVDGPMRARRKRAAGSVPEGQVLLRMKRGCRIQDTRAWATVEAIVTHCDQAVWKTRRARKLGSCKTEAERQAVEDQERERWVEKCIDLMEEADLPAVQEARTSSDPRKALACALGGLRAKTIRARVRTWCKVRIWMIGCYKCCFPTAVGQMLDYLSDLVDGDCGRSVPGSVAAALHTFEKRGGVSSRDRISDSVLWNGALRDAQTALRRRHGTTVQKAPTILLMMILSMELYVCNKGRERHRRLVAWVRLLKCWGCMRTSDTQGINPARLTLTAQGLRGFLEVTKTTGPNKKTGELPFFVHRLAGFSGKDWLREGFMILQMPEYQFERSYLLPMCDAGFTGPIQKKAEYNDAASMGRQMLRELRRPIGGHGSWEELDEVRLLHELGPLFWTEHSDRHFLPTVMACLGYSKPDRDYMGRWGVDSAKQSDDYMVAARKFVTSRQSEVCSQLSGVVAEYDEFDVLDDYRKHLEDKGVGKVEAGEWAKRLQVGDAQTFGLDQDWPALECRSEDHAAGDGSLFGEDDGGELLVPEAAVERSGALGSEAVKAGKLARCPSETAYWYSVSSKKGFRRLHRLGGCWMDPRQDCSTAVGLDDLEGVSVDARCLLCWPEKPRAMEEGSGPESTESSSTEEEPGPSGRQEEHSGSLPMGRVRGAAFLSDECLEVLD